MKIAISLSETIVSIFIIVYGLIAMSFTAGLFIYHTRLTLTNQTTKEELKKIYGGPMGNPFNR